MPCTGLCTGLYTLQTTDSLGCRSYNIFSVAQNNNISGVISSTHATCAQCNDGQLQVNNLNGTAPYTYTWIPSGGNLNTASQLKPGCYTVQVQDAGTCKTTLNACIGIRTGLEGEIINPEILLTYPNPVYNRLYAEYPDKNIQIQLYDALGRLVAQSDVAYQKATLSLNQLAKGLYQAHIQIQGIQLV
ncbi:MAG: T9SS C-terminal target domain-containing protein, partial [Gammaproteobacteria bacterium]|nr:T9SS C-terminal target domain-containing protein [Gammaproteobacteria bacterium]